MPLEDDGHACDGFDGDESERIRRLELENDILHEVAASLKAASPRATTNGAMTNRAMTW